MFSFECVFIYLFGFSVLLVALFLPYCGPMAVLATGLRIFVLECPCLFVIGAYLGTSAEPVQFHLPLGFRR